MNGAGGQPPGSETIIVVDDDQAFRRSMEQFLKAAGYRSLSFPSAAAFLASEPPDGPACVLVDLRMPRMSGLELQRALTQMGRRCAVVFLSGHGDVKATATAMKAGAVDFIEKPYDEHALLEAIERALARDRREREMQSSRSDARERLTRLTAAERTVCELLAEGMTSKVIATRLGKAESTVKMQRWSAMSKLRISTTVELARLLERARVDET